MVRKLVQVAAAMLMLALAYHFGAGTAGAQAPGNPIVASLGGGTSGYSMAFVTANGDLYYSPSGSISGPFTLAGNVFNGGAPVATQRTSWGQLKARYR